jgi:diadenosine tetraphosphate (Ap4A) HIT family hydrolase
MSIADDQCELCRGAGGDVLWRDALCRIVRVAETGYPGYCRVVWNDHVGEMTDLCAADRRHFMSVVFALEAALRARLQPDKINLASLGNKVAHLHWHVIPRWSDDRHFPGTIWSAPEREAKARRSPGSAALRAAIVDALAEDQGGNA